MLTKIIREINKFYNFISSQKTTHIYGIKTKSTTQPWQNGGENVLKLIKKTRKERTNVVKKASPRNEIFVSTFILQNQSIFHLFMFSKENTYYQLY